MSLNKTICSQDEQLKLMLISLRTYVLIRIMLKRLSHPRLDHIRRCFSTAKREQIVPLAGRCFRCSARLHSRPHIRLRVHSALSCSAVYDRHMSTAAPASGGVRAISDVLADWYAQVHRRYSLRLPLSVADRLFSVFLLQ